MNSSINKKKIIFFTNRKFLKYVFIGILFFTFFIFIYYELVKKKMLYNIIREVSVKYNYQLTNVEINSLKRIQKSEVDNIIYRYYDQSIFLLPLEEISNSINQLSWVKDVNLSINFINKLNIEILEYNPIGLLFYNNHFFYFSKSGKIIDQLSEKTKESLIIFYGKQASRKASNFLNIINKLEMANFIKEAYYINERRWDVKLHNEIVLNLSETDIEESLKNYIKLLKKLDNSDIFTIKSIDLRNSEKAIISYK